MAEFTNISEQTVTSGSNVLFSATPVCSGKCIVHRTGSGLVTLRGLTNQANARFLIMFGGNIAAVTTAGAISLGITINGEVVGSSSMISTPSAVSEYNNVSSSIYVTVPQGCCVTIGVENSSNQSVLVENANLIVTRVA